MLYAFLVGFQSVGATSDDSSPAFLTTPVANFTDSESTATEQNGRIALKVAFSHEFSGRLAYRVAGTAVRGMDFDLPESTIETSSLVREVGIVINLRDDALVEDVETIRVTLLPGEGYQLGSAQQHTVSIQDNDAAWRVVHDVDGMRFDYGMRIIRNGGSTVATVTSDDGNGLPAGTYPVNLRSADDSRFEAIVGPVTVAADRTLLGAEIDRTFTLLANSSEEGHKVDYERLLIGTATETWTSEGASHLTRGNPISGTFLMSRTIGGGVTSENTREERSKEIDKTTTSALAGRGAESECEVADMSGTSNYAVMPGKPGSQAPRSPEMGRVGQPFVAAHIPYPNFVTETLDRAREDLYYDKAPTEEAKRLAAFRYRTLLYKEEKDVDAITYILAQFDEIDDLWSCDEKKRAHQTAQTVIDALRYAPWNRELRWALLDIYYDIAVADKALAQEKHVAVAELMIKGTSTEPGELIGKEIAILEDALPLYRSALAGYMKVIQGTFGVDVADFEADPALHGEPFGYLIFRQEVPQRSPLAALFQNDDGDWVLPRDAGIGDERPRLFQGYKDVTLLFELLREYLRTAEQLSKRYVMRSEPSDFDRAERLIDEVLLATWLEGNALLAMFPEILEESEDKPIDPKAGLREAVAGWRHLYSALGHLRSLLSGGDTNILGLPDDDYFPIVAQSVIPGDPGKGYFHSYDYLADFLENEVKRAMDAWRGARTSYKDYRDKQDQLALQFADRNKEYDERLRQIVGVMPGERGYDDPSGNVNGEISQQHTSVRNAAIIVAKNSKMIENLHKEIHREIESWGEKKKINNARQSIIVKSGDEQANLSVRIAEINAKQIRASNAVGNFVSLLGTFGLAAATGGAAAPFIAATGMVGSVLQASNASSQESMESAKGELQASKERLAAAERAELASLEDKLLDVDIKTRIQKLLLRMNVLVFESEDAALRCQREMQRLSALYLEKEALERRKAESNELLADRYFADPSHRLLSHVAVLRSQASFASAQRYLFMAILAAEYKWNAPFEYTTDEGITFTKQSLFRARNAHDLKPLSIALNKWDRSRRDSLRDNRSGVTSYKFSIRDHLGFKAEFKGEDNQKCDHKKEPCVPSNSHSAQALEKFQSFIADSNNYMKPEDTGLPIDPRFTKVLKLEFGTAYGTDELLLSSRWNEKVSYLRIELQGAERKRSGLNSILSGYLTYGGTSRIRNQLERETTEYPVRSWSYDGSRWTSEGVFGSAVQIRLWDDPDVPEEEYKTKTFNELSVATTDWTLYIPVELEGESLVDVGKITDVVFHIGFYFYTG